MERREKTEEIEERRGEELRGEGRREEGRRGWETDGRTDARTDE